MKSGRLSFTTNGAGERQVDVAELERVFAATDAEQPQSDATHVAVLNAQLDAERRQNALLERTCEDLRRRLDEADAERRNVQTQLSAQLADRRDPSIERAIRRSQQFGGCCPGWLRSIDKLILGGSVSSALLQPAPHCASSLVG